MCRRSLRELVTPYAVGTVDQIGPADHNFLVRRAGPLSFDRGPQVGPPRAGWQSHLNKHEPHRLKGNLQAYFGRWSKLTRRAGTLSGNRGAEVGPPLAGRDAAAGVPPQQTRTSQVRILPGVFPEIAVSLADPLMGGA